MLTLLIATGLFVPDGDTDPGMPSNVVTPQARVIVIPGPGGRNVEIGE